MNFFILWVAYGEYEWVENYPDHPQDYAWCHEYYGTSAYIILPMEKYPQEFKETPEDKLLNSIFNK